MIAMSIADFVTANPKKIKEIIVAVSTEDFRSYLESELLPYPDHKDYKAPWTLRLDK